MKFRLVVVSLLAVSCLPSSWGAPASATVPPSACTVQGTPGPDVLRGTPRDDLVCGFGGDDVLRGRGGNDRLLGGAGDDVVRGGAGRDLLLGEGGRDDLDGDSGRDRSFGGPGQDLCAYDPQDDRLRSCAFDDEDPVIEDIEVLTPTVDVSSGPQDVVIRVHVTDDSEPYIRWVSLHDSRVDGALLDRFDRELVEGDAGDGWWELRRTVPRGFPASDLRLSIRVEDIAGGYAQADRSWAVDVIDTDPHPLPEVTLLRPGGAVPVDVRDGLRRVVVTARVLVPGSTVVRGGVELCLEHVASVRLDACARDAELVSGDRHDGVWRGQVTLRPGDLPGEWGPLVRVADRARPDQPYDHVGRWGAGRRWTLSGAPWAPLATDTEAVVVLTSRVADAPPQLAGATLSQGTVARPPVDSVEQLPLEVEATDEGGSPITSVAVHLIRLDDGVRLGGGGSTLTDNGTGVWTGSHTIWSGSTPGRYALVVGPILTVRQFHRTRRYG